MKIVDYSFAVEVCKLAIRKQDDEWDSWFLICSKEGTGKTNLVLNLIETVDSLKGYVTPISAVTRNIKEFITYLDGIEDFKVLALDEGKELDSKRTMEGISKDIESASTVIRSKCLIVFLTFTNPAKMQTYFNVDRVKGIFIIRRRGLVYFYTASHFGWILEEIKNFRVKSINRFFKFSPDAIFRSEKYTGHLLKEYLERKDANIKKVLSDLRKKHGSKIQYFTLSKASEYLDLNKKYLKKLLKSGEIKYKTNLHGNVFRIRKEDLDQYKEKYTSENTF